MNTLPHKLNAIITLRYPPPQDSPSRILAIGGPVSSLGSSRGWLHWLRRHRSKYKHQLLNTSHCILIILLLTGLTHPFCWNSFSLSVFVSVRAGVSGAVTNGQITCVAREMVMQRQVSESSDAGNPTSSWSCSLALIHTAPPGGIKPTTNARWREDVPFITLLVFF